MAEAAKTYADLVSLIEKSEKEYDLALIEKAYKFAEAAHQGQVRRSGEPYIIHPIAVAYKLVEFGMDTPSVVAGLLHDVIEDTPVTYDDIVKAFGKEIANLTDGVTKLGKIPFSSREEQQAENLRKMLIAMSEDIRVIIIKFADRMHNLATLEYVAPQKQRDKALECLEVYAPIAHRLGMRKVKEYMEDVSLKYLDPVAYKEIEDSLEARSTKRKQFIETTKEMIRSRVEPLIPGVYIEGRVKSVNGIYRKMFIQGKSFDEIYDVFALRDIEDTADGGKIKERYNGSGATVRGLNAEGRAVFTRWFELQAGVTWQRSRYVEPEYWSEDKTVPPVRRMFRTPDLYGYFTASLKPLRNFTADVTGTCTGEMLVQHMAGSGVERDVAVTTPAFCDVNLRLAYDLRVYKEITLQLYGGVQNLFNAYQKDFDKGVDRDSGYIYGPSLPRSWFIGAKVSF